MTTPILIVGDGPDQKTGLGRIGHDLAWVLSSMPEFRVGYLGRNAFGRIKHPWVQYSIRPEDGWGARRFSEAWGDFSRGQEGIVFTVWDATRLDWFAEEKGKFRKWGYFMQDACGVEHSKLPASTAYVMSKYDRVLLASRWAYNLASNSNLGTNLDWIPHGINRGVFHPRERLYARSGWGRTDSDLIVGSVMANQERKYWPLAIEAASKLDAWLWVHSDLMRYYWDIEALAIEYGMAKKIIWEGGEVLGREFTDEELALRYSSLDALIIVSGGEGFCYPVAEAMSCGTPVVTGAYGAQAELVGEPLAAPSGLFVHTIHNVVRASYRAESVLAVAQKVIGSDRKWWAGRAEHLDWTKLGRVWKKWFRRGLA